MLVKDEQLVTCRRDLRIFFSRCRGLAVLMYIDTTIEHDTTRRLKVAIESYAEDPPQSSLSPTVFAIGAWNSAIFIRVPRWIHTLNYRYH